MTPLIVFPFGQQNRTVTEKEKNCFNFDKTRDYCSNPEKNKWYLDSNPIAVKLLIKYLLAAASIPAVLCLPSVGDSQVSTAVLSAVLFSLKAQEQERSLCS